MFGNNPFSGWATQETVQEAHGGMVCKDCGCEQGKADPDCGCSHDSKDPNGDHWVSKESYHKMKKAKNESVQEQKFVIPEEIPANERTAFHGAAAAASKAGKTHFTFNGKKHPVTMQKHVANKIIDQKEGTDEAKRVVYSDKPDSLVSLKIKNPKKKSGETATMNPKLDSGKGKSEMEQKESTIRSKLMAVLERKENHSPNKDKAEKPEDALKGAGAKKMAADNADDGRYHDMEKQSHDDASKAGRAGPNMKARPNDNKAGDKKIINPADDITKKGQAPAVKMEQYDTFGPLKAAYASMYEKKDEEENGDQPS